MPPRDAPHMAKLSQSGLDKCAFQAARAPAVKKEPAEAVGAPDSQQVVAAGKPAGSEAAPTELVTSAASSVKHVAADKGLYNKFKYRLGLLQGVAAKAANDHHKELMTSGDEAAVQAFMNEMVNTKGAAAEKIVQKRELVDDTFSHEEEGWVSFELGAPKEGWDCLLDMV